MNYQRKTSAPFPMVHGSWFMVHRGVSLVEIIIGAALILLSLTGLTAAYSFYLKVGLKNTNALKAAFLLQEGVEAAVLIRDDGWNVFASLATGTPYHLYWNGAMWNTTTTPVAVDGVFERTVIFDDVYRRNSDDDIVGQTSGDPKSLDAETKRVSVRVFVENSATTTLDKRMVTYLTNLFE
ncbi:MAG: hypothetical protein UY62_C0044G0005 [Parcubacteria group bacterium GW2011_GWF2_50_9]|nr:MAG: hypothetical protein UY62_C0044G0005 [Parcubacteria group bacterium GW2011_GWF2_50_9]